MYEKLGHKAEIDRGIRFNEAMGIVVDKKEKTLYGTADPRSPDGLAVGY